MFLIRNTLMVFPPFVYCCLLRDVMCFYRKEYEGLSVLLFFYCYTLCAPDLQGARTDLLPNVSVQVLPLFERLFVSRRVQIQGLLL